MSHLSSQTIGSSSLLVPQQSLDLVQKRAFITRLHKKLGQQLNSYMLPNGYQFLNNLPVTIGGKVDRQNLLHRDLDLLYPAMGSTAESDTKGSSVVRDADANTLKAITQIFKEVLKLPQSREVEAGQLLRTRRAEHRGTQTSGQTQAHVQDHCAII
jgi:hypothetical protein